MNVSKLKKVKIAPKVKVVRKDSLGPAGAYRKADIAAPKTLQLLYVGLYKPVWEKVGPMDTVKVKTAEDVSLRGPTQKAVAAVAEKPVVAADLIKKVTVVGAKNAEGVVSHMINIGVLTVVA
jgi:hypothetical protein